MRRSLYVILGCVLVVLIAIEYITLNTYGGSRRYRDYVQEPRWSKQEPCQCTRYNGVEISQINFNCSSEETSRGPHQKIISYSIFGKLPKVERRYYDGLIKSIKSAPEFYPGFLIRVHSNWPYNDSEEYRKPVCDILCNYSYVDWCDIRMVREFSNGDYHKDLVDFHGSVWRYLPIGDPNVDVIHFRDSDSRFSERELAAVKEWKEAGTGFHIMRDHPAHTDRILAGMWSYKSFNKEDDLALRRRIFNTSYARTRREDQNIAAAIVWPLAQKNMTSHDSYYCKKFKAGPYPTKRKDDWDFVAQFHDFVTHKIKKKCPVQCRPLNHTDWEFC